MSKTKNKSISDTEAKTIMCSLSRMIFFSKLLEIEYQNVLVETKVKAPIINNYIKRISSDARAIQTHISTTLSKIIPGDFPEDYSLELYECFCGLTCFNIEQLREFNAGLKGIQEMEKELEEA